MHVGWDWASQNHDVTVIDDTGTIQARFAIGHDEPSLHGLLRDLASLAARLTCQLRSSDPTASSSSACLLPDTLWCPCTPTRSTPRDCDGVPDGPSPTRPTATCWLTTSAPMATDSAASDRSTRSLANSKHWSACEMITSQRAPLRPTSSTHCWKRIGQAPTPSSPGLDPPSRWSSSMTTRHQSPQRASVKPVSPCSAGDTLELTPDSGV